MGVLSVVVYLLSDQVDLASRGVDDMPAIRTGLSGSAALGVLLVTSLLLLVVLTRKAIDPGTGLPCQCRGNAPAGQIMGKVDRPDNRCSRDLATAQPFLWELGRFACQAFSYPGPAGTHNT